MHYVLSVLLLLVLLPAAQAQDKDKEAEKLFRDLEKKIKAADAVQVTFDIELRAIKGEGGRKQAQGQGEQG